MTMKDVSEKTGISLDYLSKLNLRKKDNPTIDKLELISSATGATIDEVIKAIRG
jgi:transcriptional regulator with XRE-family HTH domain